MMASSFVFLLLSIFLLTAESTVHQEQQLPQSDGPDSSIQIQVDQLKSHIITLESSAADQALQLQSKDDLLSEKEEIIRGMADRIASLETEVFSFGKKEETDSDEQARKAFARASELEKLVDTLRKESEVKDNEKGTLESQRQMLEKNFGELHSKIAKLEEIIKEQETRIRKTERALKVAEEELMKAKFEATSKVQELTEVHSAWLPPWLATHVIRYQLLLEKNWNIHGKPVAGKVTQKALEKISKSEKWVEPYVETIKIKYIPAVKEQWVVMTTAVKPHTQSLKEKTAKAYNTSKTTVTPHVIKVQELVYPYVQKAKKVSKPYIDQVATSTKPHLDKVRVSLTPYTKAVINSYGNFLESATIYHQQVQVTVQQKLEQHELTRSFATKEFVWFAASALLALPIIILFRVCSAISCKKEKIPIGNGNSHHARRKAKRPHSDK